MTSDSEIVRSMTGPGKITARAQVQAVSQLIRDLDSGKWVPLPQANRGQSKQDRDLLCPSTSHSKM